MHLLWDKDHPWCESLFMKTNIKKAPYLDSQISASATSASNLMHWHLGLFLIFTRCTNYLT